MFKMQLSVKKKSGQVLEYFVQPRNKRIGILLVPKMVKVEDIVGADTEDFKRILEELKSKKWYISEVERFIFCYWDT